MNNPNISRLVLLRTSLENDYKHTLWFGKPEASDSKNNQTNYFLGRKLGSQYDYTNLTYIRKDNSVKVPAKYDDIVGCNYVMYQNSSDTKWYYAFVVDMKYINEGVTELILETDVIQTWYFAYTVQPSFVEREHVNDDTTGLHTYPEQVELGEYIVNRDVTIKYSAPLGGSMYIVLGVTEYPINSSWYDVRGDVYTGVFSAVKYYAFTTDDEGYKELKDFIKQYDKGHAEAIQCLFLCPKHLISVDDDNSVKPSNKVGTKYINNHIDGVLQEEDGENMHSTISTNTINGYTPRNNKLMTFPYRYFNVSNNCGSSVTYKYEYFYHLKDGVKTPLVPSFIIAGCLTPGCSVRMIPQYYKGSINNLDEGINLGKYPICNWNSDLYTNWLTQNGMNIGVDIAGGIINTAVGVGLLATGAGGLVGGSVALSGITQIGNTIGQIHQMSFTPPQVKGNINNGDVITASGINNFTFYDMSIKEEYARIIDGYFDMFGYKVCRVKRPNTNHRSRYWYIKTIDVNIDGNIPNRDIQKIKDAYNNGITFWRNGNEIGDYGKSNGIVNLG